MRKFKREIQFTLDENDEVTHWRKIRALDTAMHALTLNLHHLGDVRFPLSAKITIDCNGINCALVLLIEEDE